MLTPAEAAARMATDTGLPGMPPPDDPDIESPSWRAWFRARYEAAGKPVCRRCDGLIEMDEEAVVHAGWCLSCELDWCQARVLEPLVARLGRRGALHALTELVRRAK